MVVPKNYLGPFGRRMRVPTARVKISIIAVEWLTDNDMIAHPSKFHALIMAKKYHYR